MVGSWSLHSDKIISLLHFPYRAQIEENKLYTYKGIFSDIISALLVLDNFVLFWFAAAEGNTTSFAGANSHTRTVEINVHVPILIKKKQC